jgi:circadian clock protein KaiB
METKDVKASTEQFENALGGAGKERYVLRLFVQGETPKSLRAIENLERICREHLDGRYEIEIIDAEKNPDKLDEEQIVALPALIKKLPAPLRQYVGDLSDVESVLVGLTLLPRDAAGS